MRKVTFQETVEWHRCFQTWRLLFHKCWIEINAEINDHGVTEFKTNIKYGDAEIGCTESYSTLETAQVRSESMLRKYLKEHSSNVELLEESK